MGRVIAVEAVLDRWFVDAVGAVWERGDAVFPIDPRLPDHAVRALLDLAGPAEVWWAEGSTVARAERRPVDDGDAVVVATSGSTGEPKLAVLTHDGLRAAADASSRRLGVDPSADQWLACLPLAHIGGFGVVARALITGTPLVMLARATPEAVRSVTDAAPTWVSLVATMLDRLDPSWFAGVLLGGGADHRDRPANVVRTYGMTETSGGVVYDGTPLDGVEVRSVEGELQVRGPMLLRAYRGPDGDVDPRSVDGWLATGDAGDVAHDGTVRVLGRLDDAIVTGGEKVWPEPVEAALRRHPLVADVLVHGEADPTWGHRVVARVVPHSAGDAPSLDALRDSARDVLAPWALPRSLVVVETIDRTPSGKVVRRDTATDPT